MPTQQYICRRMSWR